MKICPHIFIYCTPENFSRSSIRESEYETVLQWLKKYGLDNGWVQDYSSKDYYCPDFEKVQPFVIE